MLIERADIYYTQHCRNLTLPIYLRIIAIGYAQVLRLTVQLEYLLPSKMMRGLLNTTIVSILGVNLCLLRETSLHE